jgi:hypothetical protein
MIMKCHLRWYGGFWTSAIAAALIVAVFSELVAQDMPVPPIVQARFFKKIFAYDKTLPKEQIKLAVVYADASNEVKNEIVDAFTAIGISATAVKTPQLSTLAGVHVVYVAPGVDLRPVKEYCRANGVLSITGVPKWVRDGDVSITIDAVNDQPKILANADRLKTEKQDAPDLLRFR